MRENDITTDNRQELVTRGEARSIVDVHVPAGGRDFRHVLDRRCRCPYSTRICDNILQGIYDQSLLAAAATMDVGRVSAVRGQANE